MNTDTLRSMDTNEQIKTIIFEARMALHNAHLYLRTAEIISRKHEGNPTIGEPLSEATARCEGDDGIPAIISRIKSNLSTKQNKNADTINNQKCSDGGDCGIGGYCPECPNNKDSGAS